MNTLIKLHYMVRTVLLFLTLIILILFSVVSVYAEPEQKEPEPGGWIEVVCSTVPEDFDGSVSIVITDAETDERYTIDCLKANGFVGRQKLPYGKYFVDWIYTSDTFYYEGFTDLYSFELSKEMSAAKKIEIEVIKNNVPDDVFTMTPGIQSNEETADSKISDENKDSEKGSDAGPLEISPTVDKVDAKQDGDASTHDGDLQKEELSSENSITTKSVLRDIGISLLVTVVFVAVVALIVYFVRSKYFEEE